MGLSPVGPTKPDPSPPPWVVVVSSRSGAPKSVSIGGAEATVETIDCRRCGADKPKLAKAPFRSDLGESILEQICVNCWADWLQHQTLLINHYGLDPRETKAKDFLYAQIENVLLGEGDAEQVDTSKEGSIKW